MNDKTKTIYDLANVICKGLVAKPDQVKVTIHEHRIGNRLSIEITKAAEDQPRLIGKNGANFKSINYILQHAGKLYDLDVELSIPPQSDKHIDSYTPFQPNPEWSHKKMLKDIKHVCEAVFQYSCQIDVFNAQAATAFDIVCSEDEVNVDIDKLGDAISRIFHGHGNSQGRKVRVNIGRTKEE